MVWLKLVHISAVALSGAGMLFRGIAVQLDWPVMQQKWTRIAPHIVDTVLLASAIGLCLQLSWYPIQQAWLSAKVVALLAYIVLGTYAIKRGKNKAQKRLFLILALLCFSYIVGVALNHSSLSFIAYWI